MPGTQYTLSIITLAGLAAAGMYGFAQPESITVGGLKWMPVEQTVGDVGPLGTSQRMVPVDLRLQSNFARVYKLDAKPRFFGDTNEYFMRKNAAVTAIFPRSSYSQTERGVIIDVPAGTVYSIGGNLNQLFANQPQPSARPPANPNDKPATPVRPDYRVPTQPPTTPATPPATPSKPAEKASEVRPQPSAPPQRSIWSDDAYRQERIAKLLDQAAQRK